MLRPMKAMDRQTTASDSFTNDALSSAPVPVALPEPPGAVFSRARRTGRHSTLPTRAGTTNSGARRRPPEATTAVTMSGAAAKPRLPPTENQPIAVWLPRLTSRATRADSGW